MTNVRVKRKTVIDDKEIQEELKKVDSIKDEYFRLRAKAVIALLESGKRRGELAMLELQDIKTDTEFLYITFKLEKKRRKKTVDGKTVIVRKNPVLRTKKFNLTSPFAKIILEYLAYLKEHNPDVIYVFPSGKTIFGHTYIVYPYTHLRGWQIWKIIKDINARDWPHQHRERRAAKVVLADEKNLGHTTMETIYGVKRALDLEREQTAWNYVRRFETQKVEEEDSVIM
jgi:integrase